MIRSVYRPRSGSIRTDLRPHEFTKALKDLRGILWVDLFNEPPEVSKPILEEIFEFHPLAIDDALEERHVPKVDNWEDYLYLVLRAAVFNKANDPPLVMPELDLFLGKNYMVTLHEEPIAAVDQVWTICRQDRHCLRQGAGYLLYKLLDELVAAYIPIVEDMDETIDLIEDQLFEHPTPDDLEDIFTLKRSLLDLRRIMLPQREVLNKLTRDKYKVISTRDRVFFRDVYDHLVRLYDIIESLRDIVSSALHTYLSIVNNRMNDVMKTLTVITTLFMPLSFIVGFFGMNFFQAAAPLNFWTNRLAFTATLTIMIILPVSMFFWIRRRGWM